MIISRITLLSTGSSLSTLEKDIKTMADLSLMASESLSHYIRIISMLKLEIL